jgi:hypothetical protein
MTAVTISVDHPKKIPGTGTPDGKAPKTNPVIAFLGCHPLHARGKLSGILTYQDNGLVVSYGRQGITGNLGNDFGVLLICSLPPSEFKVNNTKTDFETNGRYPKIRAEFIREFRKYVDERQRDAGSESQELAREEYNAATGIATHLDWMQCESCNKWRLFGARAGMTPQEFKTYAANHEGKDWCCWFSGSPVQPSRCPPGAPNGCHVPCDFENFESLFDDSTVGQVDLQPASYSSPLESRSRAEGGTSRSLCLTRSPSGNKIEASAAAGSKKRKIDRTESSDESSDGSSDDSSDDVPLGGRHVDRRTAAPVAAAAAPRDSLSTDVKILKLSERHKLIIVSRKCAEGHFCDVHEATFYGEPVALKELKDKCDKQELIKEARHLSKLNHGAIPNLKFIDTESCQIGLE